MAYVDGFVLPLPKKNLEVPRDGDPCRKIWREPERSNTANA
jgi:hypothetical protein